MQEDSISSLSHHLLRRWENGEQDAATQIFERYVDRLVRLVNAKLASTMRARFDPEDVVQSAFREFFDKARNHEFVLRRSGALWSLLATITLNKLYGQIELQQAKKRSPSSEDGPLGSDLHDSLQFIDREPTPDEVAGVVDEINAVMSRLRPAHRQILAMRMQGAKIERIANEVNRAEATVQQVLREAEKNLQSRL